MDTSFISKDNINNLYEYINTDIVKNHKYNLNDDEKYKKIVKKLVKTLFTQLNNNNKVLLMGDFNNLAQLKTTEYLITSISKNKGKIKQNSEQSSNSFNKYDTNLIEETCNNDKKKKIKKNRTKKIDSDNYIQQIKESNRKIKDNFKKLINDDINLNNSLQLNDNDNNNNDNKNSLLNSFESIIENKLNNSNEYNNYDQPSMNELLKSVIIKQSDNSNPLNVDTYEKEEYLPNYISKIGEEAPVQPLLYQNSGYGSERINKKTIIVDSGSVTNNLDTVTNLDGTNKWHKYKVDLEETIKLDKLTDIYLKSFTIINPATITKSMYFVLHIDEFEIRTHSNNAFLRNKIVILNNTISSGPAIIFAVNYPTSTNYVSTINPITLSSLSITLTDENNKNVSTGDKVFDSIHNVNRIIFELEFKSVGERDEIIIDKNIDIEELNKMNTLVNR